MICAVPGNRGIFIPRYLSAGQYFDYLNSILIYLELLLDLLTNILPSTGESTKDLKRGLERDLTVIMVLYF